MEIPLHRVGKSMKPPSSSHAGARNAVGFCFEACSGSQPWQAGQIPTMKI